jgi:hypothetical protein
VLPLPSLVRIGIGGASEPKSRSCNGRGAEGDRDIPGSGGIGGGGSLDGGGKEAANAIHSLNSAINRFRTWGDSAWSTSVSFLIIRTCRESF